MEKLIEELKKHFKDYKDTPEEVEEVLIPFVKKVLEFPLKERRKLLPVIRDLGWIKEGNAKRLCESGQRSFLTTVEFVCANKREIGILGDMSFDLLCRALSIYRPAWFSNFINESYWNYYYLTYEELLQLQDMGYLEELAPKRIAYTLANDLRTLKGLKYTFDSSLLSKHDITLKEHIWAIFEYESLVDVVDSGAKEAYEKDDTAEDERVSVALCRFSLDGRLDRNRLLKATLAAFHRNFKKGLVGWFAALFEMLQPTTEELLPLQEEMMQVFTSSYTKPIYVMLQQLKKIASETDFRYQEFVERVTPLFFSSPKNSLLTICAIFEQLADRYPEMQETCCIALCQLFLKKDESLQKKAADFILKYADGSSSLLRETLQSYQPEMLQSIQGMLASFISSSSTTAEEAITEIRICREDNRIPFPAGKDDFLFQLSRLFDMEESWEVDTTIASLIAFHPQLNEDDFDRIDPLFRRAYKEWGEMYTILLATFLMEYRRLWTHPTSLTGSLKNMCLRLGEKITGTDRSGGVYDERFIERLARWKPYDGKRTCYRPVKYLWLEVIRKIKDKDPLPLLSTPTHIPAYIEASEFVKRLALYQEANTTPCSWDFQLAIARCAPEDKEKALAMACRLLKGEYLHLCQFLWEENTLPQPPYTYQSAWIAAGLVKEPETEFEAFKSFSCKTLPHAYLAGNYSWQAPAPSDEQDCTNTKRLQIDFPQGKKMGKSDPHSLWQENLVINSECNADDSAYMERLFTFFPNRPEPLVAQVVSCYMAFEAPQEDCKRSVVCALRMLLSFHCPLGEMSLLLLGGSLLFADKTARSYAAELWVEGLTAGRIDNHRLGEILARLIDMDIAPLKRFITQAYENMYKRSAFHNQRLEELLTVFIGGLPDKPVTGQKQLLELYLELLSVNGNRVTDEKVRERLAVWEKNTNLKKVIASLNNRGCTESK